MREITAFMDTGGQIHESRDACLESDARIALADAFAGMGNNERDICVTAVIRNLHAVVDALLPLSTYRDRPAEHAEER